jgi:hypothetical protein
MKSGAKVLVAGVRVVEEALVVSFALPFPFPFPFPLPIRACLSFVAAFFFDTAAVGLLPGSFLAGIFLVLAMA